MNHSFPGKRSFVSKLFFNWFGGKIRLGQRKVIQFDDTIPVPTNFAAKSVYAEFLRLLKDVCDQDNSTNTIVGPRVLWKTFHNLIFYDFWAGGLYRLCNDVLVLSAPLWVAGLIRSAESSDSTLMFRFAVLLSATQLAQALFLQRFIDHCFNSGQKVVTAAVSAVFHSSLRRPRGSPSLSIAEIFNIQSKDAASLREFVVFAHNLWACPLLAIGALLLLVTIIGWAALVSVTLLCALVPVETALAKYARIYRKQVLQASDERISLIHEVVDGIKTIKLTNLAEHMQHCISRLREDELRKAWRSIRVGIVNSFLVQSTNIIVSACTLTAYTLFYPGEDLTADRMFSALAVINVLGRPIKVIPKCIALLTEVNVSLERLASVVLFPLDAADFCSSSFPLLAVNEPRVELHCGKTLNQRSNAERRFDLRNINLSMQGPGLVAVVGCNSSGKSALFSMILDHLIPEIDADSSLGELLNQSRSTSRRIAYCGHNPWLMSGTVLFNIILGRLHEPNELIIREDLCIEELSAPLKETILDVCTRCCLIEDFLLWPNGINTWLGEKGINVSSGQRARIALARALYSGAGVLLLDSTLAGLDASVGIDVLTKAIKKASEIALVLITTHDVNLLQYCDRIIFMAMGVISYDGKPSDFLFNMAHLGYKIDSENEPAVTASLKRPPKVDVTIGPSFLHSCKSNKSLSVLSDISHAGSQSSLLYAGYFYACGVEYCVFVIFLSIVAYASVGLGDALLSQWADNNNGGMFPKESSPETLVPPTLSWYYFIAVTVMTVNIVRYSLYALLGVKASRRMHYDLCVSILHAKFSFFDETPSGRIYSRFSSDFETIDFHIPGGLVSSLDAALNVIISVSLICYFRPAFIIPMLPIVYLYLSIQAKYRVVSRELKRMVSGTKSPVFSYFREVLSGLSCICGYGIEGDMLRRHFRLVDDNARARLNWDACNRWLGVRVDLIGAMIVSSTAFFVVVSANRLSGGLVGLLLSYALKATNSLSLVVRSTTALENMFTSTERVIEYSKLEGEEERDVYPSETAEIQNLLQADSQSTSVAVTDFHLDTINSHMQLTSPIFYGNKLPNSVQGSTGKRAVPLLQLVKLRASYTPDGPDILVDLDVTLQQGRLYGVCGRTGSGKSTLAMAMARTLDRSKRPDHVSLFFRGVAAADIPLKQYRAQVQLFPQDYYIFSGTVREAIDPLGRHTDIELNAVLQSISGAVSNTCRCSHVMTLAQKVSSGGSNVSAGQRQIIAFARAALSAADLIILDEFDSDMDPSVSRRVLSMLKADLVARGKTILMICHKLESAFSCDELFVMDQGSILEKGEPHSLLESGGLFSYMVSSRSGNN